MLRKFNSHLRSFLIAVFFTIPVVVQSQATPDTKEADTTLGNQPKPVPVFNIMEEIERTIKQLNQIEKKIEPRKSVMKIDSMLPLYVDFISGSRKDVQRFMVANPNRQKVDNQIKKWNGFLDYLSDWESTINDYEERNAILAEEIYFSDKTWELTYQNAELENVPSSLLSDIKNVRQEVKAIYKKIKDENNYYLRLESRISDQVFIIEEVIEELIALKNSKVYKLFYLRHQPLWKTSFKIVKKDTAEKAGVESITGNISNIFSFVKSSENDIYLFILIIALFSTVIIYLKRIFLKYDFKEPREDLQNAKDLITKQTAWCIVFITILCAIFFFINTPQLFDDILALLLLISTLPLLQPYLDRRFKNIIYFIILIFVLDVSKTYFWFSSPHYRLYILFQALLIASILFYLTYPFLRTKELYKKGKGAFLIRLTPVVYFFIIISVISNVLGYTNLTDLAIKICIQSSVLFIVFYAILKTADALSIGIIHNSYCRKNDYDPIKKSTIELKVLQSLRILIGIFWAIYFLKMIDLLRPLTELLNGILTEPYKVGGITFTLDTLLSFIGILAASFIITSFISFLLDGKEINLKIVKLPKGIPAAISLVIRYFILAFGFILALSVLGIDLSKFNLMAGALGLGIGFGLQNIVSNFISGIILVFERPILPGDSVEVNKLLGTVKKIGVRSSKISTYEGAEVVVPNNNLISNDLINWTLSDNIKRIEIVVGTSYDSDPNRILKLLVEIALGHEDVLETPQPKALFSQFGESSLDFRLLFWVHFEKGLQTKSDVTLGIYNKFKELNIEIPFPQRVVHLPKGFNDIQETEN
jgi:small-conductance mechanosensitive channel